MHAKSRVLGALLVCVLTACEAVPPTSIPVASQVPDVSQSPVAVAPAPEPTQDVGPLVGGVPESVDGQPVFIAARLRSEIAHGAGAGPILAGGWFRDGDSPTGFCVFNPPPRQVDLCGNGFDLFDGRTGYWETTLSMGWPRAIDLEQAYSADRAVVLRIHSHDATCTAEVRAAYPQLDCAHIAVLDGVVWLGPVETEPPMPTAAPTQPADGLTREEAISIARRRIARDWAGALDLKCARIRVYSDVEHGLHLTIDGRNDPWVWAVVFRGGRFGYERIIINYASGQVLEQEGVGSAGSDWVSC
jgi:hypothetical protein